jgi:hypothetical protein
MVPMKSVVTLDTYESLSKKGRQGLSLAYGYREGETS